MSAPVEKSHDEGVVGQCEDVALIADTLYHIFPHQVALLHHLDSIEVVSSQLPSEVHPAALRRSQVVSTVPQLECT